MYSSSCLCGEVKYQVNGELADIVLCHCSKCRKATGGAFAGVAPVKAAELQVIYFAGRGLPQPKSRRRTAAVH